MEYTIKDLSRLTDKSQQSIYKLINKNTEFAEIVKNNSRSIGLNHSKLYSKPCLDWLINYYKIQLVDDGVGQDKIEEKSASNPQTNAPSKPVESGLSTALNQTEAKIKRLKKKIKSLKAENERLLAENDRLLSLLEKEQEQRQGLLMTMIAEKKEKHILLEEPQAKRKHWWNK